MTAGSFVIHPDIERIVICDIEGLVPQVVPPYFKEENYDVINDPRVEVIHDDARHFLLATKERFDIITSDPFEPRVKGVATLYTEEHYELVKQHLNPGGVVAQYVLVNENSTDAVKTAFATFFAAFPDGLVWINDDDGFVGDVVLTGQLGPAQIDVDALQRRWARKDHARVVKSLEEVGFSSVIDLLASYGGRGADLEPWLERAAINRDRNLRLQYLAGMYSDDGPQTITEMLSYRRFPEDLFVATPKAEQPLRKAFEVPPGLTGDEKEAFEVAIEEIKSFGEDDLAKKFAKEVEDLYKGGSLKDQIVWLETYTSEEISEEEQEKFDAYIKDLTKEEKDTEIKAWGETSNAGKRYYLRYVDSEDLS
jgi:spermidine synthase